MTAQQRREQLLSVGKELFANRGYEAVTVEEIAAAAEVSKPVVYEHFGGKEGLYAVIVDREMQSLLKSITDSLTSEHPRVLLEQAATALFDYIENETDGFAVLVRDSPVPAGSYASLMVEIAGHVEHLMAKQFKARGYSTRLAPMYAQMLVGMVSVTGQWWLDVRKPSKDEVVAHLVNLTYNGFAHLEHKPRRITDA